MQWKASGRTVQQLQFFYLASLNYFPATRISSVVTLLAKINFLAWGRESLVPKSLSDLLHLCSWWQAAIFHESKMVLACESAQFNPFIWWPHTKQENIIIGRKKCCGRMNPVFNRMSSSEEMFSDEYFKMLLLSYIPVCSFLTSRSSYSGCAHNLTIVGVRASPEEKNAIWKGLLVLFCLIGFSFAFKYLIKTSSLLSFCLLVPFFTVSHGRIIYVRTYWSILTIWILELFCLTVMGCLVIFTIFRLLFPMSPSTYVTPSVTIGHYSKGDEKSNYQKLANIQFLQLHSKVICTT